MVGINEMLKRRRPGENVSIEADGTAAKCDLFCFGNRRQYGLGPSVDALVDGMTQPDDVS